MEILFSCRNCIHNPGQSLNVGPGVGFCLQFNSIIRDPETTTCKYLHRKDLPFFVVEEGVSEHAGEFATVPGMADLYTRAPIKRAFYSERAAWERGEFDAITRAIALYHGSEPAWRFIAPFAGGLDGRHALAHAGLVRRYMSGCDTWTSSYRLILALLQDIDVEPRFEARSLLVEGSDERADVEEQALWDVVFARISGLQEYGWHSGIEALLWATDNLNGALSSLDWQLLQPEFTRARASWTELVIEHAREEGVFFPATEQSEEKAVAAE
jgi:hypothetical protein